MNQSTSEHERMAALYQAAQELMDSTEVPAVYQCLRTVVNNLHWALWISGSEPHFAPGYLSWPDGSGFGVHAP